MSKEISKTFLNSVAGIPIYSPATVMMPVDTSYLDPILLDGKFMRALPAAELLKFPVEHLAQWGHRKCRYTLITHELIAWLKEQIGERSCVEICAGMGDIGNALGVPMTDSYQQVRDPATILLYKMSSQPTIQPPKEVQEIFANAAVRALKPKVVIGSWVTQLYQCGDEENRVGSNVNGPNEFDILDHCETYIHLGNLLTHKDKRLLQRAHEDYKFAWYVTRSMTPQHNMIWVWDRNKEAT